MTLHVFWGVTYFLVIGGIPALVVAFATFKTHPFYATVTAMGSFYFFAALLVTIALTHLASRLSRMCLVMIAGLSFALITAMQVATTQYGVLWTAVFWSPFNYLAMPPLAVLLARHLRDNRVSGRLIALLGIAFVGTAAIEWAFVPNPVFTQAQGYAMPAYTRISPAIFCCFAVCSLVKIQHTPGPVISFMSRYALASYCVQAFVLVFTRDIGLPVIPKTIFDLSATYVIAYLLGRFVLKDQLLESGHRRPPDR